MKTEIKRQLEQQVNGMFTELSDFCDYKLKMWGAKGHIEAESTIDDLYYCLDFKLVGDMGVDITTIVLERVQVNGIDRWFPKHDTHQEDIKGIEDILKELLINRFNNLQS